MHNTDLRQNNIDFKRLNLLESYYYFQNWQIPFIHKVNSFLLDSGAFSFMHAPNKKVDWDKYLEDYAKLIVQSNIDLFFELDIDMIIGKKKTNQLRNRLEKLTKKKPIWVFQSGRDIAEFKEAIKEYPYVAIPLSGKDPLSSSRKKLRHHLNYMCDLAHAENTKIHGLGFTVANIHDYRFDSVDSTSWIYGNRAGFLYRFDGQNVVKIRKPVGTRMIHYKVAEHNFWEWVKYSEFLEKKGIKLYLAGNSKKTILTKG